jgi:hypothetical protein
VNKFFAALFLLLGGLLASPAVVPNWSYYIPYEEPPPGQVYINGYSDRAGKENAGIAVLYSHNGEGKCVWLDRFGRVLMHTNNFFISGEPATRQFVKITRTTLWIQEHNIESNRICKLRWTRRGIRVRYKNLEPGQAVRANFTYSLTGRRGYYSLFSNGDGLSIARVAF